MRMRNLRTRKSHIKDQDKENDMAGTNPGDRLGMVWPLTLNAWIFKGEHFAESRLQRDIVRIQRRER